MRTILIAVLVSFATTLPTLPALAAGDCLGSDPAAAADAAQLRAAREAIDAACPCASFSGAPGRSRGNYVSCAKAVLKAALAGGQLRKQCRTLATYGVTRSTCGYGTAKPKVACIKTSRAGKVSCSVTATTACQGAGKVSCPAYENCLDAADTNHDLRVGGGDDGRCNPLVPCLNPPRPDGTPCDDGVACTANDVCTGRACAGTAYACDAPAVCQQPGTCNGDGTCAFAAKPDGTTCDDGVDVRPPLTCTAGTCGTCIAAGICSTTTSRSCVVDGHCPSGETCVADIPPSPRFADNRDGTVTDRQTCLVWEKKGGYDGTPVACPGGASCADPHDADNRYAWSSTPGGAYTGALFTDFLAGLNAAGFAGHANWRLPDEPGAAAPFTGPRELATLVDATAPGCGSGAPCTPAAFQTSCTASCNASDPTCSCTAPTDTWTMTYDGGTNAWSVDFADATTASLDKTSLLAARAVRGGLPRIDCAAQPAALQSTTGPLLNACYDQCRSYGDFYIYCLFGCGAAEFDFSGTLTQSVSDACLADPGAGCDAYRVAVEAACTALGTPPADCVRLCVGEPICQSKCVEAVNCPSIAQGMYDACVATNR